MALFERGRTALPALRRHARDRFGQFAQAKTKRLLAAIDKATAKKKR